MLLRLPWYEQPPLGVDLDPRWLGQGTNVVVWRPEMPDFVSGYSADGVSPTFGVGQAGARGVFDGSTQYWRGRINSTEATPRLLFAVAETASTAAGERYTTSVSTFASSNYLCRIGQTGSSFKLQFRNASSSSINVDVAGIQTGRLYVIVGYFPAGGETAELWVNGSLIGAGTMPSTGSLEIARYQIGGGRAYSGALQVWNGSIYLAGHIEGQRVSEYVRPIAENPWQLFEPRRIWVPMGTGSSGTTYFQSVSGSSSFTSGIVKSTYKYPSSTVIKTSSLNKFTTKSFSSSVESSGNPNPSTGFEQLNSGSTTLNGDVNTSVTFVRNYSSVLTASGGLVKAIEKFLAGSITLVGSLTKKMYLLVSGAISSTGTANGFKFTPTVSGFINRGMRFMRKFIGRR